jgi:hypothetical protein
LLDRATVGASVGLKLVSEVGMNDEMHDGTAVGDSLRSREGETLGNKDGLLDGATDGASVGFTVGSEVGMNDGIHDGMNFGASLW